jgi:hypothetical protein
MNCLHRFLIFETEQLKYIFFAECAFDALPALVIQLLTARLAELHNFSVCTSTWRKWHLGQLCCRYSDIRLRTQQRNHIIKLIMGCFEAFQSFDPVSVTIRFAELNVPCDVHMRKQHACCRFDGQHGLTLS